MYFMLIPVMSAPLFCMKYRPAAHLHKGTEIRSVIPNWIIQRHGDDTITNTTPVVPCVSKSSTFIKYLICALIAEVCLGREISAIKHLSVLWFDYIQDTTRETNQRCDRCVMDLNFTAHSGFTLKCQLQNYGTDCFDLWFMCLGC